VTVHLTVEDSSGHFATTNKEFEFAQTFSSEPRSACPVPLKTQIGTAVARAARSLKVGPTAVSTAMPCNQSIDCSGQILATKVSGFKGAASRPRVEKPLAFKAFSVKAGEKKRVRAKLTRAAKRTLRKRGKLQAKVRVSLVDPTGKVITKTRKVTFRAERR
jgi:hypothetical protein